MELLELKAMLLCDFKKRKHFALTGFMRNNKKDINLKKYIYNVPELTDPLIFIKSSWSGSQVSALFSSFFTNTNNIEPLNI